MAKLSKIGKRAGRPRGVNQDRTLAMRVNKEFLRQVDEWRRNEPDIPQRAEAVRRMVKLVSEGS